MTRNHWLLQLAKRWFSQHGRARNAGIRHVSAAARRWIKPRLEVLEDRLAPAAYSLTDLGSLGGALSDGSATGLDGSVGDFWNGAPSSSEVINNSGQIVGGAVMGGTSEFVHGFLYDNGHMTDLGNLPSTTDPESIATGINDSGQVVGESFDESGAPLAFLYGNGQMADLNSLVTSGSTLGTLEYANAINNNGQIIGELAPNVAGDQFAFLDSNGSVTELVDPFVNGGYSVADDINDSGQVVGFINTGTTTPGTTFSDAFLYSNGTMTNLGTLLSSTDSGVITSEAIAINSSGEVVGDVFSDNEGSYAFLYSNGTMTNLGAGHAYAINDSGQVVGSDGLYSNGKWTDLNSLIPSGSNVYLGDAVGINDNGQIVAVGSDSSDALPTNGYSGKNLYLLTPSQSTPITITNGMASPTILTNGTEVVGVPENGSSEQVTVSATVSVNGSPATNGNVVFSLIGPATVASDWPNGVTVASNGEASDTLTVQNGVPAGSYALQVSYVNNNQTTTQTFYEVLTIIPPTQNVIFNGAVTPNTLSYTGGGNGQQVTVSALIYNDGSPVSTGSVIFSIVAGDFSTVATDSGNGTNGVTVGTNGKATDKLTVPAGTAIGTYSLYVYYTVNNQTPFAIFDNALVINSAPANVSLSPVAPITASSNDQYLSLTATVTTSSGTGTVNEGEVDFTLIRNGSPVEGSYTPSANVVNGQAVLTNSYAFDVFANTPAGNYTIQAAYIDLPSNYVASAPATTPLIINPAPPGSPPPAPPPAPPPVSPPPSSPPASPPSPPASPPPSSSPIATEGLNVPPLLAFFDQLLGGTATINDQGTVTITDSFFGIPLLVSTFDRSGELASVLMFGIDVTPLFLLF